VLAAIRISIGSPSTSVVSTVLPATKDRWARLSFGTLFAATVIPEPSDYFDLDQGLAGALGERSLERLIQVNVGNAVP